MSASVPQSVQPTLALQPLPRHVRELLQIAMRICSDSLGESVMAAVQDLELLLIERIDQLVFGEEHQRLRAVVATVEASRTTLAASFLAALEAEIALLQSPVVVRGQMTTRVRRAEEMTLVNDQDIEETSALTDAATRAEVQNSLPLFLLGQRFGVIAGRPAFDAETLPVGPQALCRSIRRASERINLDTGARLLMYRAFEKNVMRDYGSLVGKLNTELAAKGVLPNLQYVPVRARRVAQNVEGGGRGADGNRLDDAQPSQGGGDASGGGTRPPRQDKTGYKSPSEARTERAKQAAQILMQVAATHGGALASDEGYAVLRQLLNGRRQLLGKLGPGRERESPETARHKISANDLQDALRGMQLRPVAPVVSQGRSTSRNINHLKQDLLALLRRVSPEQEAPELSEEHNDAIDLVAMMYDNLNREVKPNGTVAGMLTKLQVPVMRVALEDQSFFTRQDHPARQMLSAVADTSNWLNEDESDGPLVGQLNSIVDRAVSEYRGDSGIFQNVLSELLGHLQTLARKAEVSERRHVEAAQGKERLTLARESAARGIEGLLKDQKLPQFTRTMLSQAWTDVMALTALRQGEDSTQWHQQLSVAEKLMHISQRPPRSPAEPADAELQRDIEEGLAKVGYPESDVGAIAKRLLEPNSTEDDDSASSRTELTLRLKSQARLGQDLQAKKTKRIPLNSGEQVTLERLQQLPTGAVFEFTGPQGEKAKRRLAWFSSATGATLFVNLRGQKFTDLTMDELARQVAKGQAQVMDEQKGTVVDRAWDNVLTALRSFAVPEGEGA